MPRAASAVLGRPGELSFRTTWEAVLAEEPDVIVVAACGFSHDESVERTVGLDLPVRTVIVDGDAHFSRPAPRLADGVRQLAHLLHPERESPTRVFRSPSARLLAPGTYPRPE